MEEYAEVRATTSTRVRFSEHPQAERHHTHCEAPGNKDEENLSFNSLKSNMKDTKSPQKQGVKEH